MEHKDLKEIDKYGAFSEFIPVSMAAEHYAPEAYSGIINQRCECGSERIITINMRRFMCCNPRCPIKVAKTLEYMFKQFSCRDIGYKTCKKIVDEVYDSLEMKSHLEILNINHKENPLSLGDAAYHNFITACEKVRNSPLTFPMMVSNLGIPGFDKSAMKALHDINDVNMLYDKMAAAGGVKSFLEERGVYDPMKAFYLSQFIHDIVLAQCSIFKKIMPLGKVKITIVISKNISLYGRKITKADYVALCNQIGIYNGIRAFDIERNDAISTTQFLIADENMMSTKIGIAQERQMLEGRKLIYTPEEFIDYLKGIVECARSLMGPT